MTPRSCEGADVHGRIGAAGVLGWPWMSLPTEHEGTPTSTASLCVIVGDRGVGVGMQSFRAWEQVTPSQLWLPCWEEVGLDLIDCVGVPGGGVARMLGEGAVHEAVWGSSGWGRCMQRSEPGRRSFDGDLSAELTSKRVLRFLPVFVNGTHKPHPVFISKKQDVCGQHLIMVTLNISIAV